MPTLSFLSIGQKRSQKKSKKKWSWLKKILVGVFLLLSLAFVAAGIGSLFLLSDLPSPTTLINNENYAVSTQIFSRNDELLYEIFADEHRIPIKLAELPPHVYQAAISIEDQHFFTHHGFDLRGIVRAAWKNYRGDRLEGGSTITQQLVKNALLTRERSYERKLREIALSILTELMYTKEEILEMYLNYISYGGTSVGIEAASQAYFGKSAKALTVAEAALLAGLPQAPSTYSPFGSRPEQAKLRQQAVLRRMVEDGYLTQAQVDEAAAEVLTFALKKTDIQAPHFVFYVRDLLYEMYGVETVEKGGLRVRTTLDLELQDFVQTAVAEEIEDIEKWNVTNGAAVVIHPDTGEVLSMVGSRNYFDSENDGQFNVTLAERQPGSSIKPLMYAAAFQDGLLNPGTFLLDAPTCFEVAGQLPYCPRNYSGGFVGPVTVRRALGNSYNIPAVKGIELLGVERFISYGRDLGITSWQDPSRYGLSLTLGGGEVRMIDLAQAFSVLANQGVYMPVSPLLEVTTFRGEVLFEASPDELKAELAYLTLYPAEQTGAVARRVLDRGPAYLTSHIMQDNQARADAFGTRSELVIPDQIVSAKTGTTNDLKDNWTVGFTPEYLVITWVGNNNNSPMNRSIVSGVTGAAPLFNTLMSHLLEGRESVWQEKPADVLSAGVCLHGFPNTVPDQDGETNCGIRGQDLYWERSQPSATKEYRSEIWIDPNTGRPPPQDQHVDGLLVTERTFFQDPTMKQPYCLDCPKEEDGE